MKKWSAFKLVKYSKSSQCKLNLTTIKYRLRVIWCLDILFLYGARNMFNVFE